MNYPLSQRGRTYAIVIGLTFLLILLVAIVFGGYRLVLYTSQPDKQPELQNVSVTIPDGGDEHAAKEIKTDPLAYERAMAHIVNGDSSGKWPVKTEAALPGSIFPYKRIIAYYGNLYSK
jgi:hypothetical protein